MTRLPPLQEKGTAEDVDVLTNVPDDDEKGPLGLNTLYEPRDATPIAEIVFIHGLGGGSRKTWSKSPDGRHYWPKTWLSADPDFRDTRIHSFGYNADWGRPKQSVMNIHGFAEALLCELKNHPSIRRGTAGIILVAHSMGGCVAKKMYLLARQDPSSAELASRIRAMYFLATPHRGSDLAEALQNLLLVTLGSKPYVGDLLPNSAALAEINDAFRHHAHDLRLWSFYETAPLRIGLMNKLIVDKFSATLGFPGEEICPMEAADHRQVCKFDADTDPNYKRLRNALSTSLDTIRSSSESNSICVVCWRQYIDK